MSLWQLLVLAVGVVLAGGSAGAAFLVLKGARQTRSEQKKDQLTHLLARSEPRRNRR